MHTSEYEHDDTYTGKSSWTFNHNGDYSGDVHLIVPAERAEVKTSLYRDEYVEIDVPFEVLRNFVLDQMRSQFISEMESASYDALASWFTATVERRGD